MSESMPSATPRVFEGGLAVDDRGTLGFVNDFQFQGNSEEIREPNSIRR